MKSKRLFLIAGYSAVKKIDASLIYMLKSLSFCGDVILMLDSDISKEELDKISSYVIHVHASRHGEYDFGSYKRAYQYAKDKKILKEYDFVYMINDSVYGPIKDIKPYLQQMESFDADAFGLVCNPNKDHPHIQSWFIGMRKTIFLSRWFDEFITSVTKQPNKGAITRLYEQGFSKLVTEHGGNWLCIYTISGRGIYNNIKKLYKHGLPFIKKVSFTRHNGSLGKEIYYVMRHINKEASTAIISGAKTTFGEKYISWLLTRNPIKIFLRNIKYFIKKLFNEGL